MPAGEDVVAVGRPRRAVDEPAPLARHLFRVLPLRIHRPDVPQPVTVARERDALAVGAEARLHVEGGPARDPCRRRRPRSSDRHHVDVAEQIEDHLPAVGADVEVHPRAFGGVEGDLLGRPEVRVHVPLLGIRPCCCVHRSLAEVEARGRQMKQPRGSRPRQLTFFICPLECFRDCATDTSTPPCGTDAKLRRS